MEIKIRNGKYGTNDKIILFRSNKSDHYEKVTIFKCGLLLNQLSFNEMLTKDGKYKRMACISGEYQKLENAPLFQGDPRGTIFFREAMVEAMNMGIVGVNWAESHNWPHVQAWANKWYLNIEVVDALERTFQTGLNEF